MTETRRYPCCACCQGIAKEDHVGFGGTIMPDAHDGPCDTCEFEERIRPRLAAAWDEGYTSGHSNAMRRMSDEPNAPTTPNPYASADA